MQGPPPRPFGKRNPVPPASGSRARAVVEVDPHRDFFAAVRAKTEVAEPTGPVEVPRSLRAAALAGIVVACGLAGLDATEKLAAWRGFGDALPDHPETRLLAPALILLAVLGGGQSAATSLLVSHSALRRVGETGHVAYALGGAAAAALFAAAFLLVLGQAPAHGLPVAIAAGAASGFFYRVFAGTTPAASSAKP